MNYSATILIVLGAGALVVGIRGSYKSIWAKLTGGNPDVGGFASGNFTPGFASGNFASSLNTGSTSTYQQLAAADAQSVGLNPLIFVRQIQQESGFNPNARSSAGALGIAQFMPATAAGLGVNPLDPRASLQAAARYMASLVSQFGGSQEEALAAYNAGPGAVQNALASGDNWLAQLPVETQNYVNSIMGSGMQV